ncbi:hypothetical protein G7K_2341-t1 [Saitoella complicata NRRL Y-17804]|uniref:non-specific serine/threonine protein kinase n=2 Tax=Saitoella complicata (strain BCRC 22490 / CBS 7301 / JCM 7358 / NBRC 10748 / NRRL Y-17804) TaxID=698492 RepID=A0A0E9NEN4_SAICN|nr:hypothetical protein G7K_2341-t1 [Saitoella complicata NRRL Y-17804]
MSCSSSSSSRHNDRFGNVYDNTMDPKIGAGMKDRLEVQDTRLYMPEPRPGITRMHGTPAPPTPQQFSHTTYPTYPEYDDEEDEVVFAPRSETPKPKSSPLKPEAQTQSINKISAPVFAPRLPPTTTAPSDVVSLLEALADGSRGSPTPAASGFGTPHRPPLRSRTISHDASLAFSARAQTPGTFSFEHKRLEKVPEIQVGEARPQTPIFARADFRPPSVRTPSPVKQQVTPMANIVEHVDDEEDEEDEIILGSPPKRAEAVEEFTPTMEEPAPVRTAKTAERAPRQENATAKAAEGKEVDEAAMDSPQKSMVEYESSEDEARPSVVDYESSEDEGELVIGASLEVKSETQATTVMAHINDVIVDVKAESVLPAVEEAVEDAELEVQDDDGYNEKRVSQEVTIDEAEKDIVAMEAVQTAAGYIPEIPPVAPLQFTKKSSPAEIQLSYEPTPPPAAVAEPPAVEEHSKRFVAPPQTPPKGLRLPHATLTLPSLAAPTPQIQVQTPGSTMLDADAADIWLKAHDAGFLNSPKKRPVAGEEREEVGELNSEGERLLQDLLRENGTADAGLGNIIGQDTARELEEVLGGALAAEESRPWTPELGVGIDWQMAAAPLAEKPNMSVPMVLEQEAAAQPEGELVLEDESDLSEVSDVEEEEEMDLDAENDVSDLVEDEEDSDEPGYEPSPEPEPPLHVKEEMKNFELTFLNLRNSYRLIDKIGEGTFSSVYKAEDLRYREYRNEWDMSQDSSLTSSSPPLSKKRKLMRRMNRPRFVAIKKIYVTSSPQRILNELEILHELGGCDSVVPLITAFRHEDQVAAVLPYCKHVDFRDYFQTLTLHDIRLYFKSLFSGLEYVHERDIMHRDIKPSNFLYDVQKMKGVLVDFGLAEYTREREGFLEEDPLCVCSTYEHEEAPNSIAPIAGEPLHGYRKHDQRPSKRANRAGTRGFRAPEVLFKCNYQGTAIDIWSSGVILLSFLTKRFPFFNSTDDVEALLELCSIWGKQLMKETAALHGCSFESNIPTLHDRRITFKKLIPWATSRENNVPFTEEEELAMDFLEGCLDLNCKTRFTATQALQHAFLADVSIYDGEGAYE